MTHITFPDWNFYFSFISTYLDSISLEPTHEAVLTPLLVSTVGRSSPLTHSPAPVTASHLPPLLPSSLQSLCWKMSPLLTSQKVAHWASWELGMWNRTWYPRTKFNLQNGGESWIHTFHSRDVFPQFSFAAFAVQGHPQDHNLKEKFRKITTSHPPCLIWDYTFIIRKSEMIEKGPWVRLDLWDQWTRNEVLRKDNPENF